jgi:hypothetical protein
MNTKLPYSSFGDLMAAYRNGVKFRVAKAGVTYPVTRVELLNGGLSVYSEKHGKYPWTAFKADGTNGYCADRLELVVEVTAVPAPFLKRFVNGEPAYNPATREVVVGVSFVSGAIEVLLKDEAGQERVSTRYDHEGKHRWVPGRSLVIGALPPAPPKMKKVELRIYEDRANGGFFLLTPAQVLPNYTRFAGLQPLKTVEVEVKA